MPANPLDYQSNAEVVDRPIRFWGIGLFVSLFGFLLSFPLTIVLNLVGLKIHVAALGIWIAWITCSICALKYLLASNGMDVRTSIWGIPIRVLAYIVAGIWSAIGLLFILFLLLTVIVACFSPF